MDGYRPETYGERWAEIYDDQYASVSDVDGTVRRIVELAGEGPVLELGVGTGRLAIPLADAGLTVLGVDASDAMLARLAAKRSGSSSRALAIRADMAALPIRPRSPVTVAFAAFNTLFNLTSPEAQGRCLRAVAGLLAPDGRLVVEGFLPGPPPPRPERDISATVIELDRVVLSATVHEPDRRTITGQRIEITERGVNLRPWVICYASPDQLDEMARDAGFELEHRHGGWRDDAMTLDSDRHVSTYRLR